MKAPKKPAGAKCTAETAELRKVQPNRPERKQRRGTQAGKEEGENCGKTAEKLRNLSLSSVSFPKTGALSPSARSLVKLQTPVNRREEAPGAAPATRGGGWPIDAALAILSHRVREPGAALCSPGIAFKGAAGESAAVASAQVPQ